MEEIDGGVIDASDDAIDVDLTLGDDDIADDTEDETIDGDAASTNNNGVAMEEDTEDDDDTSDEDSRTEGDDRCAFRSH